MLTAYVRARTFDVLQKVTYHWRIREDLTSTGQQKARIANLRDRIAVKEEAHELLRGRGLGGGVRRVGGPHPGGGLPALPAARARRRRGLPRPARRDLPHLPGPGDARGLRDGPGRRCACAPSSPRRSAGTTCSPRTTTCARCRTRRRPASSTVAWSRTSPPSAPGPRRCRPTVAGWLRWRATSRGQSSTSSGPRAALRITGWAWLRGLDMRGPAGGTSVQAWLVDAATRAQRITLEVEQRLLPEADEWGPAGQRVARRWRVRGHRRPHLAQPGRAGSSRCGSSRTASSRPASCTAGWPGRLRCGRRRASWTGSASPPTGTPAPASRCTWRRVSRSTRGASWSRSRVTELDGDDLVLLVRDSDERVGDVALVPRDSVGPPEDRRLPLVAQVRDGDRTRLTFALTTTDPDGSERPAPMGAYVLRPDAGHQAVARMSLPPGRPSSPVRMLTSTHRIDVGLRPPLRAVVVLGPTAAARRARSGQPAPAPGPHPRRRGRPRRGRVPRNRPRPGRDGRVASVTGIAPPAQRRSRPRQPVGGTTPSQPRPSSACRRTSARGSGSGPVNDDCARWRGTPTSPSGWLPGDGRA